MNNENEELVFDMDENMGSYYDFNLLDLLDEDIATMDMESSEAKLQVKLGY